MTPDFPDTDPAIQNVLDTVLPDAATLSERTDFARGLALLAELLGDVAAGEKRVISRRGGRE